MNNSDKTYLFVMHMKKFMHFAGCIYIYDIRLFVNNHVHNSSDSVSQHCTLCLFTYNVY